MVAQYKRYDITLGFYQSKRVDMTIASGECELSYFTLIKQSDFVRNNNDCKELISGDRTTNTMKFAYQCYFCCSVNKLGKSR